MQDIQFTAVTQSEIDAILRAAKAERSQAVAAWVRSALNWLAHPGFSTRHA